MASRRAALLAAVLLACGPGERSPAPPPGEPDDPHEPALLPPSGLVYPFPSALLAVGVPMAPNVPALAGGAPTSWSVEPPLPSGLALDPGTGAVSGTPGAVSPSATFVVRAGNDAGAATAAIAVEVAPRGEVRIRPAHAAVVTRATVRFEAAVAGEDAAFTWSASAGAVGEDGLYTAPRLPGTATVTATAPGGGAAAAEVSIVPATHGNVEVTVTSPAPGAVVTGAVPLVAAVSTRYLFGGVEADLDGAPVALETDGSGVWRGTLDVSGPGPERRWLRVAAWDFALSTTEVFREVTVAR